MKWFLLCCAGQIAAESFNPGSVGFRVGQVVYDPQGSRVTVTSVFEDGTTVVRDPWGKVRNYSGQSLGVTEGRIEGVSVGDRVYTLQGHSGTLEALYPNGGVLVDYTYRAGKALVPARQLGRVGGSLDQLHCEDSVYTHTGVFGKVKCFYSDGRAYVDYHYKSGGTIVPVDTLGRCTGKVLDFEVGEQIYTSRGVLGQIRCFYKEGKALVDYVSRPGGEIAPVASLGVCSGTLDHVETGSTVYTSKGDRMKVLAIYLNGQVLLDEIYGPGKCMSHASSLGIARGKLNDIRIGEEAISPTGRYGRVKAIYPNQKVLLMYLDDEGGAEGGIFAIRNLKFKKSKRFQTDQSNPESNPSPIQSESLPDAQAIMESHSTSLGGDQEGGVERRGESVRGSSEGAQTVLPDSHSSSERVEESGLSGASSPAGHVSQVRENEVQDRDLCKICFDQEIKVILVPCGHFVLCETCADAVHECPMCRSKMESKQKVYR